MAASRPFRASITERAALARPTDPPQGFDSSSPASSQKIRAAPSRRPTSASFRATRSEISGRSSRSVCSAASSAILLKRSSRTVRVCVNCVATGWMACTPSSVAFSTMKSVSAFFTGANNRVRCGPSAAACSRICSTGTIIATLPSGAASSHSHSPSRPLKTRN